MQNKIASSIQNGKKNASYFMLFSPPNQKRLRRILLLQPSSGTPNMVSSYSPVGQETVWPLILSSPCGLKWSNFKAKRDHVCCRMEKDLPQGQEDDQAINLKSLYKSMRRRMKAVVDAQSGHSNH